MTPLRSAMAGASISSPARVQSHRLATNLRWLVLAQVATKLATLASIFLLARYLGDELFGRFAIALAIPTALEAFADFGVSWALVREGAGRPDLARRLAFAAAPAKLAPGAAMVGLTFAIASSLSLPADVVQTAVLLAVAKALDSLTYLGRAVFQSYERMEFDAAAQALDAVVRLLLISYALLGGFGLVGLAKALVVAAAIVFAGTAAFALHRFLRPIEVDLGLLPGLVAAGLPLAAVWLLDNLSLRIGTVLVGDRLGAVAAGNYAAALRLIEPLLALPAMVGTVLLPLTTRHIVEERATLPWLFQASVKMTCLAALTATVVLLGAGPLVVRAIFGPDFQAAPGLVRIIALAVAPLFIHGLLLPFLVAFRRQIPLAVSLLAGVLINGTLLLALTPSFGATAGAVALLAGEVAMIGIAVVLVPDLRELRLLQALRVLLLGVPSVAVLLLIPVVGEVASTTLALLVMLVLVRWLRVVDQRELVYLQHAAPGLGWMSRALFAPLR